MVLARKLVLATFGIVLGLSILNQEQALASDLGGKVHPPNMIRDGYSLIDIAGAMGYAPPFLRNAPRTAIAGFQDKLSQSPDSSMLPNTPFQLLGCCLKSGCL